MVRLSFILLSIFVFALLLAAGVGKQSLAQTSSPTPTTTVPTSAPSTGFGK